MALFWNSLRRSASASSIVVPPSHPGGRSLFCGTVFWGLGVVLTAGLTVAVKPVWSETVGPSAEKLIVAAGFGHQADDGSTITVKIYDPTSGEVLSSETFDLNVKEEGNKSGDRRPRIFAGGVGPGATDLSNFMVRVYDAQTGAFQWEGQLNLVPAEETDAVQRVSVVRPRRAMVLTALVGTAPARQPSFLIRALDSLTGGVVWEDEFSTGGLPPNRLERVAGHTRNIEEAVVGHRFEFRVRMRDAGGHVVLWEDRFATEEDDEDVPNPTDDHATMLPMWPSLLDTKRRPLAI